MNKLTFAIAVILLIIASIHGALRVDSEWGGGFQAGIDIPVKRNVTDDEWEIELLFDQAVTIDAWPVNLKKKVNNSHYIYKNKFYNGRLIMGSTLNFGCLVFGGLELRPENLTSVLFDGQPVDITRA